MQGLAYYLIEFGEIGSGEREVRKCLARYSIAFKSPLRISL